MDQTTNQTPQPPDNPPPVIKSNAPLSGILITVLLTAVIVGIASYLILPNFLNCNAATVGGCDAMENEYKQQVTDLEEANLELTSQLEEYVDEEEAVVTEETGEYAGWNSITDSEHGLKWRYPELWSVQENRISSDVVIGKSGFCLNFSSPTTAVSNQAVLTVCYRDKDDSSSTTWFRTGMGYDELEKVVISLDVGGKILTEKTLFGQTNEVTDVIYAQNLAEDETGFPSRVAVGDYYLSALATDLDFSETGSGISSAYQETFDKILASLEL